MSFFDSLQPDELHSIAPYLEPVSFDEGTCILAQGTAGDDCYLIDDGRVRLELHSAELDTDAVLDFLEAGQVLGEFSLFDRGPRSASAYADTAVTARRLRRRRFDALCDEHPKLGMALLTYMAQDFTHKLRQMDAKLGTFLSRGQAPAWVDGMVTAGSAAQAEFAAWPEDAVDAILTDIAAAISADAEALGAAEVAETGLGVVEHKVLKITVACRQTLELLLGRPAAGPVVADPASGVTEVLSGVGVVLGLIPLTNPIPTLLFKTMICLKSRNALIASCHRNAMGVGGRVGEVIRDVLTRHGANPDLLQWIRQRASRATTSAFMTHPGVSLILATGGPSMVKSAYSSGTPALGVGAGNAPVWVCADADPVAAARLIVDSKSFDNGVICGSDNNIVVDSGLRRALVEALEDQGAAVLSGYEIERFTKAVVDPSTQRLRGELVGRSAPRILRAAGFERGDAVRLIVLPLEQDKVQGPWGHEKLAPVISLFTATGEDEGMALCRQILANMGSGHTAIIHTHDAELALRYAGAMPASRVLLNCAGSTGCIGIGNGLQHSWTLGCGTWGGTSTTDNVGFRHLLNVKRLAAATAEVP
ncbi:MAG: aldehyde dehydrogenase family protein [Armatimonadetes bacterium]|nr:aldehyde dehydrogenase family protein [Armatimonadota bacterium]